MCRVLSDFTNGTESRQSTSLPSSHTEAAGPLATGWWEAGRGLRPVARQPKRCFTEMLLQELRLLSNRVLSRSIFLNEGFSQFCVITAAEYLDALPLNYRLNFLD